MDLVKYEEKTVLQAFQEDDGLDAVVNEAKAFVEGFEHDLTTDAGRKRTASLAHKVAKLKVKLDDMGKDLVSDWKNKAKVVDASRKAMRDQLDALKIEARKPLTDWEEEQERIKAEEAARAEAERLAAQVESDHEIALLMNEKFDRERAEAEAEKQRKREQEERDRLEREEKMRQEAAEKARIEAEEKAKAEQERLERERQEAVEREEKARVAAKVAEERRIEQERQAKIDAERAAEKARQDEIRRQEEAQEKEKAETLAREKNRKHKAAIHNQMLEVFVSSGFSEDQARQIVKLIAGRKVPHTQINY